MSKTTKPATKPSPSPVNPGDRSRLIWLVLSLLVPLVAGGAIVFWHKASTAPQPTDSLLDRFVQHVNQGESKPFEGRGATPVFDDTPISEAEADARCAEFYLHQSGLRILAVKPGEPDRAGKMKKSPNRFTLVTKVQGSTPRFTVRNAKGVVESPSRLFMIDPDIVVEVKDGKILGVRPELHRD